MAASTITAEARHVRCPRGNSIASSRGGILGRLGFVASVLRGPPDESDVPASQCDRSTHPSSSRKPQAPGALAGTHADLVDPEDMLELLQMAPPALFDCVLDAKQKDRRS